MAKEKKSEPKVILEREYTVPLRGEWLKVPKYKRAKKAVKGLKQFMVRHMKIYDRDLKKIKVDVILNNELRFRGMKKPPAKIRVLAKKYDDGIVQVGLINIPEHVKFARLREAKLSEEVQKKTKEEKIVKEEKLDEAKEHEAKEKEQASKDESLKIAEKQAKDKKHIAKEKVMMPRKTLSR